MGLLHPPIEPDARGRLDVGDGHHVYWETCGDPGAGPALVLHGGPGSGCTSWHRRLFDPRAHRVVLFDQRNCGRSTPHAGEPRVDLSCNTTSHLIADIERLRDHLAIDRWLLLGGSWGSTLALAYAERHPERVSGMILFGVTAGAHEEFDRVFRGGLAARFPGAWTRLLAGLPPTERDGDVVAAYHRRLVDPDPAVCARAARAWCQWESATPVWPPTGELLPRFRDPAYALAFARIVTHYAQHYAWLEDGALLRGAAALAHVPAILINGRRDVQAVGTAEALRDVWPRAELAIIEDAGHAADHPAITRALLRATDRLAARA